MRNLNDKILRSKVELQNGLEHHLEAMAIAENYEEGSTTVEYAIGAIATAGFAGLLIAVLKSGGVKAMITSVIESALAI